MPELPDFLKQAPANDDGGGSNDAKTSTEQEPKKEARLTELFMYVDLGGGQEGGPYHLYLNEQQEIDVSEAPTHMREEWLTRGLPDAFGQGISILPKHGEVFLRTLAYWSGKPYSARVTTEK
jgi:hypothetical protein